MYKYRPKGFLIPLVCSATLLSTSALAGDLLVKDLLVTRDQPVEFSQVLAGEQTKRLSIDVDNGGEYATLSIFANDELIIDSLDVPSKGQQTLQALVRFDQMGDVKFRVKALSSDVTINKITVEEVDSVVIPQYKDISVQAGIDKVNSLKYGGPSVADINNNGFYDFTVNNHNDESSKLYWNNGDGTVTKHEKNLARWFMHDLHGTSFGDYNNTGSMDLLLAQGGGNGRNPSRANFYRNKDGKLVMYTGDVGIQRGARGRGSKWMDINNNGLLDLVLINERGLYGETPQHHFYKNLGDGKFEMMDVEGIQSVVSSRALVTDLNNDGIDDLIFFDLHHNLSVWLGNEDFSFTEITDQFPQELREATNITAVVDVDINNNGRRDLYFARGTNYGIAPLVDFDPELQQFSIAARPAPGSEEWTFSAPGNVKLDNYYFLGRWPFVGEDYPIFLGKDKNTTVLASKEELELSPEAALGWPEDISEDGAYFGYLGNGQWRAALVRTGARFFSYRFKLNGVTSYDIDFEPINRNYQDFLVRNDGDKFVDVTQEWNLPKGGASQGVTTGDFNNNGQQDLLIYRWGSLNHRVSDMMLLNNNGRFEAVTMHGANDVGGPGFGDMGQAFDFDNSGQVDILSGAEHGQWYLYSNQTPGLGNYTTVRVGYSPRDNIDPIAAKVELKTADNVWHKRVGSAGEVFSQSTLSIVHFGLADAKEVESIKVTWRNGETMEFANRPVNQYVDTNKPDPKALSIVSISDDLRYGAKMQLGLATKPVNADDSVVWSSSDESVVKVDQSGVVSGVGRVGKSAVITAASEINGEVAEYTLTVVDWTPRELETIQVNAEQTVMIEGDSQALTLDLQPVQSDDERVVWSSSDSSIAKVDADGQVTAIKAGEVAISATSKANDQIVSQVKLKVEPNIQGFANIVNREALKQPLEIADSIELEFEYHAGTGNKVISADEGGVRVWLRRFRKLGNRTVPRKDVVLPQAEAINTESGKLVVSIPLEEVVPTSELPEGDFYSLRATFTASDGTAYSDDINAINFIAK
ncbi:FG-GAP-like repeat-containing protein [Vibrio sp. WXL103]|uniref:FG-GAP-like repeat-containing protein n=1 Tax=Vibrio sp. WXL103 TaxID=3450710 RepID=UPI003EC53D89